MLTLKEILSIDIATLVRELVILTDTTDKPSSNYRMLGFSGIGSRYNSKNVNISHVVTSLCSCINSAGYDGCRSIGRDDLVTYDDHVTVYMILRAVS